MKKSLLLLFAVLSAPLAGFAAELSLTPSLCAIDANETRCDISVSITFAADDNQRYCLAISDRGLIRCFAGNRLRDMHVYIATDKSLEFLITEGDSGNQVASKILKVARYRPKRHRRRYGWGLL
ncbi:DUF3019 domain-containing protein [Microbulbifer sp. SAOS-129_SWC]|uniref:DUF3019 domain-containing protein n=1 Tax=Microbulbifer sp. SAOS-129_SWC TaxID=3145235 RepID=UPI0032162097